MRTGELSDRIKIQKATRTEDAAGGGSNVWADFATLWSKVEPLEGREFFTAQQFSSQVSHRVTVRYREDIDATMRVKYGSRLLNIKTRLLIKRPLHQRRLELMCEETARENV